MMKKHTSNTRKLLKGLSLIPVGATLLLVFSAQVFAQSTSATTALNVNLMGSEQSGKDEYYGGGIVRYRNASGTEITKKWESLSGEEKMTFPAPEPPTADLLKAWKNLKYKISIDYGESKRPVDQLNPKDFVSFYVNKWDGVIYVLLVTPDWLKTYKEYGGIFDDRPDGLMLIPPPPIVTPAPKKKN